MDVSWQDARGLVKKLRAKCLDISAEGARLETDMPIPARTNITLQCAPFGSLGSASVRHCSRHNSKYRLGVEFTSSLKLSTQGRKRCLDQLCSQDPQA